MVGTLIGWSLLERRRRMRGPMLIGWVVAGLAGLLLAVGTLSLNWLGLASGTTGDLLAAALSGWGLCWVVLPALFGAKESPELEHLALLPLSRRTIMTGLSATALLAPGAVLTALALVSIVGYAAPHGALAVVVGVVAAVSQLSLFVLLGRVFVAALGASLGSRGWRLVGQAAFAIVGSASWLLRLPLAGLGDRLAAGTAPTAATVLHLLPSGWAISAVEAAAGGDVLGCLAAIAALFAGCLLLWVVWAGTIRRRLGRTRNTVRRDGKAGRERRLAISPVRAVLRRELLLWVRDDRRTMVLFFTTCTGLSLGPLIAAAGVPVMLPFGGLAAVFAASIFTANLYGFDGSGIWTTMVVPGSATPDTRGRALAWLAVMAPIGVVLTIGPALAAPASVSAVLPWIAAAMPAMLGFGAGAVVLTSALAPYALPTGRTGGQLPFRLVTGPLQSVAMLTLSIAVTLSTVPSLTVVLVGVLAGSPLASWLGLPVAVAVGALSIRVLTGMAARVADRRGPEILRAAAMPA